jgi:hypothetical protein
MDRAERLENSKKPHLNSAVTTNNCNELLQLARTHKARGQQQEAEQFYALLVQILRPDHAMAELQI